MKKVLIAILLVSTSFLSRISLAQDSLTLLAELWGEEEKDWFIECASAGDVDGDGFMDIAVGTDSRGYLKIFLGGDDFDTIPDLRITLETEGPSGNYMVAFYSVACAGDVNKDGYDDLIVGDPLGPFEMGEAYIYFGGDPMDTTVDVILNDSYFYYEYGHSVSSAGDVNKDGYDDVVVGAPRDDYDGRGRAFIYLGGENMDNVFDVYIEGTPMKAEELGYSVTGIGDINADGFDDVLIGAPQFGGWPYPTGRASIYFGGDPMDSTADVTLHGDSITFLNFGRVVASAGDMNADGILDILVGGPAGYPKCVKVFVTAAGEEGLDLDTVTLCGEEIMPSAFGGLISTAGDLNGDGFDDVMVSDFQCGIELGGKVYIYYGGADMDSLFDLTLIGTNPPGFSFGLRVASAGDINGDGYDEIMVSSLGDSTGRGKVFIYTSKPTSVDENQSSMNQWGFFLGQNYPNPFNSNTIIPFTVNRKQSTVNSPIHTSLVIHNILGQKVKVLVDEKKPPGCYEVAWEGRDDSGEEVGSGVYLCRLKTGNLSEVRKMVLLK